MGFTYTDSDKIVLEAWGKFKVTLLEAVEPGDLLSWYNTDNDYTVQFADESDAQRADCIAVEKGAAGDEITACLKAVLKTISTIATGGVVTRVYFAAAADFLGAPLYLGESGKPESSVGTTFVQEVGRLLARDQILIDLTPSRILASSLDVGVSASPSVLTYNGTKSVAIYTTCASTNTGTSYEPQLISNILTGAGQVGGRFRVNLETNVRLGAWANAFKASMDWKTNGSLSGLGSVINAEMTMMASDPPSSGMYTCLEMNLTFPTGHAGDNRKSFMYLNISGNTKANFDTYGYLFELSGVTSGATKAWWDKGSAISPGTLGEMLRVRTPGGARFIALYDTRGS